MLGTNSLIENISEMLSLYTKKHFIHGLKRFKVFRFLQICRQIKFTILSLPGISNLNCMIVLIFRANIRCSSFRIFY
jgi:hypothetical protein